MVALGALDLAVPEGGVFGFLGPNGADKTTTLRCLLGLVRASGGRIRILGADPWTDLARVIHRIGCMVETPALFPGFSGASEPRLAGSDHGGRAADRQYGPRPRGFDRPRRRPGEDVLPRDEAAPQHRRGAAQGSGPASARRACDRPRPRRHRRPAPKPTPPSSNAPTGGCVR
jgi:energy-coupling factor transporter ATP-binding protein EcfA2